MDGVMDRQKGMSSPPLERIKPCSGEMLLWNVKIGKELCGHLAPPLLLGCMLPKSFPRMAVSCSKSLRE